MCVDDPVLFVVAAYGWDGDWSEQRACTNLATAFPSESVSRRSYEGVTSTLSTPRLTV